MYYDEEESREIVSQNIIANALMRFVSDRFNTQEVVLAGGMVRDWFFNKEGSDYDIYVDMPENYDADFLIANFVAPLTESEAKTYRIKELRNVRQFSKAEGDKFSYAGAAIEHIVEFETISDFDYDKPNKVQVMFLQSGLGIENYITYGFSCNLSKCWKSMIGDSVFTKQFVKGFTDRTLRFNWDFEVDGEANLEYIRKILNKFPDFEIDEQTRECLQREFSRQSFN